MAAAVWPGSPRAEAQALSRAPTRGRAAERNAELLFETRTVAEIREVAAKTQSDVEAKKEELRQLVGASYRDLIVSADSILEMQRSSEQVVANVVQMQEGFLRLRTSITTTAHPPEKEKLREDRRQLLAIGSRVKYLVDSPEIIWGFLDEHMYLDAAERFLRAYEVHRLLTGGLDKIASVTSSQQGRMLLRSFPLLRSQWPLVESLRTVIIQRSVERTQAAPIPAVEQAGALSAIALLEGLSTKKVLDHYLNARRHWLRSELRAAVARSSSSADVTDILCDVSRGLQRCISDAGELLLAPTSGQTPLLVTTIMRTHVNDRLYGGLPQPEAEVAAWEARRQQASSLMVPLGQEDVAAAVKAWMEDCAADLQVEGEAILAGAASIRALSEVESKIRQAMGDQAVFESSANWLISIFGSVPETSAWDSICQLVLRQHVDMWRTFFHQIFVQKMRSLIQQAFAGFDVATQVEEALATIAAGSGAALVAGGSVAKAAADRFPASSIRGKGEGAGGVTPKAGQKGESMVDGIAGKSEQYQSLFEDAHAVRILESCDAKLHFILEDVLYALSTQEHTTGAATTTTLGVNRLGMIGGGVVETRTAAASEIEPFLQEQCYATFMQVADDLHQTLAALSAAQAAEKAAAEKQRRHSSSQSAGPWSSSSLYLQQQGAGRVIPGTVEQSLFVGRLAGLLSSRSILLPIILGPPSQWSSRRGLGPSVATSSVAGRGKESGVRVISDTSAAAASSTLLAPLIRRMRGVMIAGFRVWITWSADTLAAFFEAGLKSDELLLMTTHPKGWEQVEVSQEDETGRKEVMKLSLPGLPTTTTLSCAYAACNAIHHAGSHTVDPTIIRLYAWVLGGKLLEVYRHFLRDPKELGQRVTEKGIIQMIFDARFLSDILAGGAELSPDDSEATSAVVVGGASGTPKASSGFGSFFGIGASSALQALKGGSTVARRSTIPNEQAGQAAARRAEWSLIVETLQSHIDPIDWATFETFLWANVQRYYQRSAVLFGSLVQLKRLYTDTPQRRTVTSDAGEANILSASTNVPRFTYLPISTPTLALSNSGASVVGKGASLSSARDRALRVNLLKSSGSAAPAPLASKPQHAPTTSSTMAAAAAAAVGDISKVASASGLKNIMGQFGQVGKFGSMLLQADANKLKGTVGEMLPSVFT